MSAPATNEGQSATNPGQDPQQPAAQDGSASNAGAEGQGAADAAKPQEEEEPQQQTRVLRSHFRGMPRQWEKNLHPDKKEGE